MCMSKIASIINWILSSYFLWSTLPCFCPSTTFGIMCRNVYETNVETTDDIYLTIKYFYFIPKFALKVTI